MINQITYLFSTLTERRRSLFTCPERTLFCWTMMSEIDGSLTIDYVSLASPGKLTLILDCY